MVVSGAWYAPVKSFAQHFEGMRLQGKSAGGITRRLRMLLRHVIAGRTGPVLGTTSDGRPHPGRGSLQQPSSAPAPCAGTVYQDDIAVVSGRDRLENAVPPPRRRAIGQSGRRVSCVARSAWARRVTAHRSGAAVHRLAAPCVDYSASAAGLPPLIVGQLVTAHLTSALAESESEPIREGNPPSSKRKRTLAKACERQETPPSGTSRGGLSSA